MWQSVHEELQPQGLTVVTVALDTGGADATREWIEKADPTHPSLIDQAHVLDELFGVVNVPSGLWIDEAGVLVRPPEPAFPRMSPYRDMEVPADLPEPFAEMLRQTKKIRTDPEKYMAALRDWVARGADSPYALTPDEVVARSRPRDKDAATAAACFELAQHLHRNGEPDAAVRWFREAHRLQPENWTYKRQAWSQVDPFQLPNDVYEGSWLDDVKAVGAENYYEPLDM